MKRGMRYNLGPSHNRVHWSSFRQGWDSESSATLVAAGLKPVLWNRLTHGQLTNGEHRNTFSATAQRPFAQLRSLAGLASFSIFHLESARPAPDNRHFGWTWYTYGRTTQPPHPPRTGKWNATDS